MDSRHAARLLTDLVEAGLAEAQGERGGREYLLAGDILPTGGGIRLGGSAPPRIAGPAAVMRALHDGAATRAEIQERTGLTARQVQFALSKLRGSGRVVLDGSPGRRDSTYRLVEE